MDLRLDACRSQRTTARRIRLAMPTRSQRSCVAFGLALAVLGGASSARAEDPPAVTPPASDPPPKATRRRGFTFGIDLGVGVASIVGYPNDLTKIGYAQYYSATGARPAGTLEAWAGVAIMDWFTVALGFKGSRLFDVDGDKAQSLGGMFHIEAFPLFPLGGHLRDLGVRFDAGLGTAGVTDANGNAIVQGGSTSTIGGGLFYEGIRAWKTAHGPFLMGDYVWSDTARRPAIFIGWRSAFYSGP
jgi:hypothetical protein